MPKKGEKSGGVELQNVTYLSERATGEVNPAYDEETPPPYNGNGFSPRNGNSSHRDSTSGSIGSRDVRVSVSTEPDSCKDESVQRQNSSSSLKFDDDNYDDDNGSTLIYSKHERLPVKHFGTEVRATKDVRRFVKDTVLLLNVHERDLDAVVTLTLQKMLEVKAQPGALDQAKAALFTHDAADGWRNPGYQQLRQTIQGTSLTEGGGYDYDQNWVCCMCTIPSVSKSRVGIARFASPVNMGLTVQEVSFVIVILTPTKEKGTKNEIETGRTFATMFSDLDLRTKLLEAASEEEFLKALEQHTQHLVERHKREPKDEGEGLVDEDKQESMRCGFLRGIRGDLKRRLPHYWSDYKDGVVGNKSIQKTISCTLFLYFAIVLPCIAFGVLNSYNTKGVLTVEKVLYSQTFGGLVFVLISGTPQIVLLTTAPLALYTQIIYSICQDYQLPFQAMYCLVGLWNAFFLILYSVFDLSVLMRWSTRSSEEIFALFISIAFTVDAVKNCVYNFDHHYNVAACFESPHGSEAFNNTTSALTTMAANTTAATTSVTSTVASTMADLNSSILDNVTSATAEPAHACQREISMLYLVLLLGTVWIGLTLFNFTKTPFLTSGKREVLADYSLPVAVIIMSFFGAFVFRDVNIGKSFDSTRKPDLFQIVDMVGMPVGAIFAAMGLGFCLSLLFFMDQNISAALVNAPANKMKKGTAYHWDLLVIAVINIVTSIFAFPWVHAALPHSPLHVQALADIEERVDQGHIHKVVVRVRETRLTCIFAHVLTGLSLLFMQILAYIPEPVLYGLFLYVAATALYSNQFFERILLFFTEQAAYPPNHYIRRVPQRQMHYFTLTQLLQLVILCVFGFFPIAYMKMFFPVLIFLLIPIRHQIIPRLIDHRYLNAMDGEH